jgi:HEAT repeat protein
MASSSERIQQLLSAECANALEVAEQLNQDDLRLLRDVIAPGTTADPGAQQNALSLLARAGDREAVPVIIERLADFDERHRISAVDALGRLGTPEAASTVLDLADDSSADVRRFAVVALARIGDAAARARLARAAEDDPADFVRRRARRALAQLDARQRGP